MRLSKDLDGKAIISISDGRFIGKAKDVYVDQDLNTLTGLFLGTEGLINRKSLVIQRQNVVLFGIDAILVKNSDVISDDKAVDEVKLWLRREKLEGREVHTPGGTKIGTVGDVILDETGRITGFALGRVFVEGPVAEQGIIDRSAVVAPQGEGGHLIVDLARQEALYTQKDPPTAAAETAASDQDSAEQNKTADTPQ